MGFLSKSGTSGKAGRAVGAPGGIGPSGWTLTMPATGQPVPAGTEDTLADTHLAFNEA